MSAIAMRGAARSAAASVCAICIAVAFSASSSAAQQPACGSAIECQRVAKSAFDAEMTTTQPCAASDPRAEDACLAATADATESHLDAFYRALEHIVSASKLRASQDAWLRYRRAQCDQVFDFYRAGTIAPSARLRCEIALARSRMRDLDALYDGPLHH